MAVQTENFMRWMWIDRFVEFKPGQSAKAVKYLSLAEDYFADHFPGYPMMPGTLMLEGLAQTGGILVGQVDQFSQNVVLGKIPWARFHRDVLAGEQLLYEVEILTHRPEGAAVSGRVLVEGKVVVEAEIFFAHLDPARAQALFGEQNFVFGGELKRMLGLVNALLAKEDTETIQSANAGAGTPRNHP
jgi:3-hydroxyacyl-[acyl-carrier-protein] dehydratase